MAIFDFRAWDGPHLFSLPPGRPFFNDLAQALLSDFDGRPEEMADARIFLPSRRSVRTLKESFARLTHGRPIILPRMTAVADISEDDVISASVERQAPPLPQAPTPVMKRLVLARIYREAREQVGAPVPDWPSALRAAGELSRTSDLLTEYGVDSAALTRLSDEPAMVEGARHWQTVVKVLSLVTEAWPAWLDAEGLIDVRSRRNALLSALADSLPTDDDAPLVLAAGFIGTSPSSQSFLKHVAHLPSGAVVLPAVDAHLTAEAWSAIEEPHPQSTYKSLFEYTFSGLQRHQVRVLPFEEVPAAKARRELLSIALMPAEATDTWTELFGAFRATKASQDALQGLSVAVAPTSEDEADWIALALRETLAQPSKTAALVTADRILARRVAAKLAGWGIEIDDSGGRPLHGSYRATFLRAIARLMDEPSDPVAMASLVHHQLFGLNLSTDKRRPLVQTFDLFLRGVRPRPGWEGLLESLADDWRPFRATEEASARVATLIGKLREVFETRDPGPDASLPDRLQGHISLAEELATTPDENGRERLFRFEDGEALERHFDALLSRGDGLAPMPSKRYTEIFDSLLGAAPAFRPPGGQHPRVSVYGILEARLQTADLLVVGGLQEGVWPGDEVVDPFLSRRMRRLLKMPTPEADIGRVALDFLDFASAPKVLLTRAERRGAAAARPSRFMIRLESFLKAIDKEGESWDRSKQLAAWQHLRHGPKGPPQAAPRPTPRPPVSVRPRRVSVSAISRWLMDPYSIYAEKVLRLRRLRQYDDPYGPAEKGTLLHAWAEEVVQRSPDPDPEVIGALMDELHDEVLHRFAFPEEQRALGGAFITAMRESFPHFHAEALKNGTVLGTEIDGQIELDVGGEAFVVNGRADRIDRDDLGAHVIDYKSSDRATTDEKKAYASQLMLLAKMTAEGAFKGMPAVAPQQVSFVNLKKSPNIFASGKTKSSGHVRGEALDAMLSRFDERFSDWLIRQFDPSTPFISQLSPHSAKDVGDYDDLARRLEWARAGGDDD